MTNMRLESFLIGIRLMLIYIKLKSRLLFFIFLLKAIDTPKGMVQCKSPYA